MYPTKWCNPLNFGLVPNPSDDVTRGRGLSRDQEREMAVLIAGGDQTARDRMVRANLGLVVTIARGFQGRGLVLEDLVGEGNLGLIRAAEHFDPDFGARFSTYASHWVKQAIRQALNNTTAIIRVPAYMVKLLTKWRRTEQMLCLEGDHMPNFEEVASSLSLSEVQKSLVREARRAGGIKLEGGCGDVPSNGFTDLAMDQHGPVEAAVQAEDEVGRMRLGMESLDDRERTVLALRYGLDGEPLAYRAIGARLGFSGEWARRIESGAIRKLGGDHDDPATARRSERKTRRACSG